MLFAAEINNSDALLSYSLVGAGCFSLSGRRRREKGVRNGSI